MLFAPAALAPKSHGQSPWRSSSARKIGHLYNHKTLRLPATATPPLAGITLAELGAGLSHARHPLRLTSPRLHRRSADALPPCCVGAQRPPCSAKRCTRDRALPG